MIRWSDGDRVELISVGCRGTIEHVEMLGANPHIRVRWDDGKVGLLYFDGSTLANANHLQRLVSNTL